MKEILIKSNTLRVDNTIHGNLETPDINILGSVKMNRTLITANYTVQPDDYIITVNNGLTNVTVTLPDATICENRIFIVKRFDNTSIGNVDIDTVSGDIQDPSLGSFGANTSLSLWGNPGYFIRIQSNGVQYEAV